MTDPTDEQVATQLDNEFRKNCCKHHFRIEARVFCPKCRINGIAIALRQERERTERRVRLEDADYIMSQEPKLKQVMTFEESAATVTLRKVHQELRRRVNQGVKNG